MRKTAMRLGVAILIALLFGASIHAETVRQKVSNDPRFVLCAVIFGVTQNADGSVKEIRVANIVDATSESKETLKIKLPKIYLMQASNAIRARSHPVHKQDGKIAEFFVYYFYSPQYPEALIDDVDADISAYE